MPAPARATARDLFQWLSYLQYPALLVALGYGAKAGWSLAMAGTASGATASIDHARRPGRLLRSVNQASAVPSTTHRGRVSTTSKTVLTSSSATRGRNTNAWICAQPTCHDTPTTKAIGSKANSDTSTARPVIHMPLRPMIRPRERVAGRAGAMSAGRDSGSN